MIAGKKYNGLQVDIWSSGVILFALLCGYLPFEDPNTAQLYKKILNCEYKIPKFVSENAKDLIKGILNTDPTKRFTIEQIRGHKWYKMINHIEHSGLIVGVHQIPIDRFILGQLEPLGIDPAYAEKCIEANKHNNASTTYYLLLVKHLRDKKKSNADLSAEDFTPVNIGKKLALARIENPNKNNAPLITEYLNISDNFPNEEHLLKPKLDANKLKAGTGESSYKDTETILNKMKNPNKNKTPILGDDLFNNKGFIQGSNQNNTFDISIPQPILAYNN